MPDESVTAASAQDAPPESRADAVTPSRLRGAGAAEFLQGFAWLTLIGCVIAGVWVIVHGNQCNNSVGYTCGGLIGAGILIIVAGIVWCAILYALGVTLEHVIAIRTSIDRSAAASEEGVQPDVRTSTGE